MRSRVRHLLFGRNGAGVGQLVCGLSSQHGALPLSARQGRRGFRLRPVGCHFLGTGLTRVTPRAVGTGGEYLLLDFGTGQRCGLLSEGGTRGERKSDDGDDLLGFHDGLLSEHG